MSRLIDADELKKMFPDKGEGAWTYNITAKAYIDAQPTIDLWHYPSKGEYPTESETVLVAFQEGGLWYFANAEYHEGGWASVVDLGNIAAWQYFVPPKEEA